MATTSYSNYSYNNCIACYLESGGCESTQPALHLHTCRKGTEASGSTGTNQTGASAYTFDNYQEDTGTTAIYPESGLGTPDSINYTILGLIGEAGEISNKWKKFYRDGTDDFNYTHRRAQIKAELGDVLWYASQLATELGVTLGDVAAENIRKLSSRQQRGTLNGSGDSR